MIANVHDRNPRTQECPKRLVELDEPGRDDIARSFKIVSQDLGTAGGVTHQMHQSFDHTTRILDLRRRELMQR